jgi:hypothetical protein
MAFGLLRSLRVVVRIHGVQGRTRKRVQHLELEQCRAQRLAVSVERQLLERALDQLRVAVRVAQESTYMTTASGMVRAGLGTAILRESAAEVDRGDDV